MDRSPLATPSETRSQTSPFSYAIGVLIAAACLASEWNIDSGNRVDFRIYYRAMKSIGGRGLYNYGVGKNVGFTYPTFAAIALRPFTWLEETASSHVWLIVSTLIAVAFFWSMLKIVDRDHLARRYRPIVVGMALWTFPVFLSFRLGQVNPLIVGLIGIDVVLMCNGRRSGIGTGLAAALKLTPLAMIAMLVVSGRRGDAGRAVASFIGATALAAVLMPNESRSFWTEKLFDTERVGHLGGANNVSLKSIVLEFVPSPAQSVVWFFGVAALAVVAAIRVRKVIGTDPVAAFTIGMCLSYAASPISWIHHQWFAVVALLVWILRARRPIDWVAVAIGVTGLLDPFGFGEKSMITGTLAVTFLVVSIAFLPTSSRTTNAIASAHDIDDSDGDNSDEGDGLLPLAPIDAEIFADTRR